jgi:hypothetical protein
MKKYYRGWTLVFNGVVYIASKKGCVPLDAPNRVEIERLIDAREFVEWKEQATATIQQANRFIRKLKKLTNEAPQFN